MKEPIDINEAVALGAVDGPFYSQFFFPKTVRQSVPDMHREIWQALEDPAWRYVAVEVFRDGAKTTLLRLYTSKRIAYGVSHNILFTSHSEAHAVRSVRWIRRQVEFNSLWAQTFQLKPGATWRDGELEIIHGVDEYPIYVLAAGITGQVRGINFDDYRPDLVVADDLDDEETVATEDQREKASGLLFGALAQGLASPTDSPLAKLALLATPLNSEDLIHQCRKDPRFRFLSFGCFDEQGQSRWESKFPTKFLLEEKQSYIARNQLPVWMREKECKIVSSELAAFRLEWLKTYSVLPEHTWFRISLDPASSDAKTADNFAIVVMGYSGNKRFLVEHHQEKGMMPDAVVTKLFAFILRYQPRDVIVETVSYQKILKWYIEKEMMRLRMFRTIREYDDKRSKADRILQAYLAFAPYGDFYVREDDTVFRTLFGVWYPTYSGKVDLLDSGAINLSVDQWLEGEDLEGEFERLAEEERNVPDVEFRQCP